MNNIWEVIDDIAFVWFWIILFVTCPIWFLPVFIYDRITELRGENNESANKQ